MMLIKWLHRPQQRKLRSLVAMATARAGFELVCRKMRGRKGAWWFAQPEWPACLSFVAQDMARCRSRARAILGLFCTCTEQGHCDVLGVQLEWRKWGMRTVRTALEGDTVGKRPLARPRIWWNDRFMLNLKVWIVGVGGGWKRSRVLWSGELWNCRFRNVGFCYSFVSFFYKLISE
jgi:hypothetical protein